MNPNFTTYLVPKTCETTENVWYFSAKVINKNFQSFWQRVWLAWIDIFVSLKWTTKILKWLNFAQHFFLTIWYDFSLLVLSISSCETNMHYLIIMWSWEKQMSITIERKVDGECTCLVWLVVSFIGSFPGMRFLATSKNSPPVMRKEPHRIKPQNQKAWG